MHHPPLPRASRDLLLLPETDLPDVVHELMRRRRLSALVQTIHSELQSEDPGLRDRARHALGRLGFTE